MRVVAGKHRGRKLLQFSGNDIRPTSDRAKEGVFSVLQFEIAGKRFLDGFCGSGAMGIEALSRGAREVVFTDCSKSSCELTKKNLEMLGENAKVIKTDLIEFLKRTDEKFDIIFLDPPYKSDAGVKALEIIAKRQILNDKGIAIIESGSVINQSIDGLFVEKRKKYGIAEFAFYKKTDNDLCVFAGSFDPVTAGHVHIVEKAKEQYKRVIVLLAVNDSKVYTFSKHKRLQMLNAAFEDSDRVTVTSYDGYLVDFLKQNNTVNNIRGIRNQSDMQYEEDMLAVNKTMFPEIRNVYIYADQNLMHVSSTWVKEQLKAGKSAYDLLPEKVAKVLDN
ncbi:MAG: 16S rRNA (guanine(966)-N(2))-methyltransferase RsmD [Clostridia bacterium]|nr:16S rRNA (guanine(966)-N(2))-methyltransferase RsmD [Clostridia bacterium]